MRYYSVFERDQDILKAISDIHLRGGWYDLDCTYSKGVFYTGIAEPKIKSDIQPLYDDVVQADSTSLDFIANDSIKSIVFDPPFLFRKRKSQNDDKISKRFSYFSSYEDLHDMYEKSLDCFKRKLTKGGYVLFKCQDMTDNKFYCTHNDIINMARDMGYELKDIIIKRSKSKLQRDAKQQNCVAKTHSYWLILKRK